MSIPFVKGSLGAVAALVMFAAPIEAQVGCGPAGASGHNCAAGAGGAAPAPSGNFPRIASLWWGGYQVLNNPTMANQIQMFLAPAFSLLQAQAMRVSNPGALIFNTVNAEETLAGQPVVPDSYYLKDTNGNKIQDWPGTPGNFILNLTNPAVATFLAQYASQQVTTSGFQYDGIFFDNVVTQISTTTTDCFGNPIQIDANGDGLPDDPATLDANWSAGVFSMIAQFHSLSPNAMISGHVNQVPPDPRALAVFNGGSLGFDAVQVREGQMAFGTLYDAYQSWMSQGQAPQITAVQSSPPSQIAYGYGYSPATTALPSTVTFGQTFYPNMRFGLAVALMSDGFSVFDFGDNNSATAWWYDEYNANLGSAVAPAVQIGAAPSSNVITNSGFESGTAPWVFSVSNDGVSSASFTLDGNNPADGNVSAHINVASAAANQWNIVLEQDNLSLVAGQEYQLQFWARASAARPMPIVLQGTAPAYTQYGLNTTLSIDSTWRLYNLSFVANSNASDGRLEFWFGTTLGDVWLDDVQMTTAPTRIYRRDYTNGIAIVNGTTSPQTIQLEAGLHKLTGSQAPKYQYIVDDSSTSFSTTGTWIVDTFDTGFRTAAGPYYHAWQSTLHEMDSGGGTAQWNLGITENGQYTIQVWLPAAPPASTWTQSAVYEVMSGSSVLASFTLNQSQASGGDQWYTVANVSLTTSGAPYLRVRNTGSGPLIADAVYVYSTSAKYNDGSSVSQVTLAPMDGILLQRSPTNQTINFPALSTQSVGGAPIVLNATASSGLPITYISNTPSICPLSNGAVTPLTLGTCSVTATQPGNGTYTAAVPVTQSFTIGATQTVTFVPPGNQVLGGGTVLNASATSGLPVTFISNAPTVCAVAGNATNLLAPGTCSVTATQTGNSTWAPAPPVTQAFVVLMPQTITFPGVGVQSPGEPTVALTPTASSSLPVTVVSTTPNVCTIANNQVTILATGSCAMVATQAGNSAYGAAPPSYQSFPVVPNVLTDGGFENSSLSPWTFNIVSDGSAAGSATLDTSNPLDGSNAARITVTGVGTLNWHVDLEEGGLTVVNGKTYRARFWARADSSRTMEVGLQSAASPYLMYGLQSTVNLTNTWTLFTITFISTASASDGRLEFRVGNATGNVWLDDVQLFTGGSLIQSINFANPGSVAVGTSPQLTATATSGLPVSFASNSTSICTVSGTTLTAVALGSCSVTASQAGTTGFLVAPNVTQSFAVLPGQTITFTGIATQTMGTAPFALSATSTSGLAVTYGSNTPSVCTVSGGTVTLVAMGTCTVTFNQAGNASYAPAPQRCQSFTVLGAQAINFPGPSTQGFGTGPLALTATAASGLAVTYASNSTSVCTVSGSSVTLVALGTCSITASQSGSSTWAPASPVTVSFTIGAGPQSISFSTPPSQLFATGTVAASATATSGLAVAFSSGTPSVCAVSGTTVAFVAVGTCSLTASQPGNSYYVAAATVTRSFSIGVSKQTITFQTVPTQSTGGKPVGLVATASSGLGVVFSSSTTSVCTVTGSNVNIMSAGTCTLAADQYGNANYYAAPEVTQSFQVKANLLTNGGFEGAVTPWQFLVSNDGVVSASDGIDTTKFADGTSSGIVSVATAATSNWRVDMEQQNLPITAGWNYQVQFWARADTARTIQVVLQGAAPNFTMYGLNTPVNITTTWQLYTVTFTAPVTATDARLEFWFGSTTGNNWLDDVQFFSL